MRANLNEIIRAQLRDAFLGREFVRIAKIVLDSAGMFWYVACMLKATSIYLDVADMKKLERLAGKDGLKASYLVRKAIKEFLQRQAEEKREK